MRSHKPQTEPFPPVRQHHRWQVALYYSAPADLPYGQLLQLQTALYADGIAVALHCPYRGWGHGQRWLWVGAARKRAVSALWAAAWTHRRMRRYWLAWEGSGGQPLGDPAKVNVTRASIEEQKWY